MSKILQNHFNPVLWGSSIALSWTWGLGLFFSVQMAIQFGMAGLLGFAIPNALGLFVFGLLTQRLANHFPAERGLERHFLNVSAHYGWVFVLYQFFAIGLTLFAAFHYVFRPLGLELPLMALLLIGVAFFLGEKFGIARIKWSHLGMLLLMIVAAIIMVASFPVISNRSGQELVATAGQEGVFSLSYLGFFIPILGGLALGPWLDLQQWQRAIRVHQEGSRIVKAYGVGSILFFLVIVFHGFVAATLFPIGGEALVRSTADGLFHAKDSIMILLFGGEFAVAAFPFQAAYVAFLMLALVSTLDSGYVALKWYLKHNIGQSDSMLLSIVPEKGLTSPVGYFVALAIIGLIAVPLGVELEYYMAFYASFSLGYSVFFLMQSVFRTRWEDRHPVVIFSIAAIALAIFGIGYFRELWWAMAIGCALPIGHAVLALSTRAVVDDLQKALEGGTDEEDESLSGKAAEKARTALEHAIERLDPRAAQSIRSALHKIEPAAAHALASVLNTIQPSEIGENNGITASPIDRNDAFEHAKGHVEDGWFCHSFMATYCDTNSVGNVYFAQYAMWVGKVREMFFNTYLQEFDLKKTPFFILTRQFEHKYINETKEFDIVTVRIRIAGFNRKFVTLEHDVLNGARTILGKGKQVLFFVNSKDYSLINIPAEVHKAFLPFIRNQGNRLAAEVAQLEG